MVDMILEESEDGLTLSPVDKPGESFFTKMGLFSS
jgi:hypothetical protein